MNDWPHAIQPATRSYWSMEDQFEVDYIFGKKLDATSAKYNVKWKNYPKKEASWEPDYDNLYEQNQHSLLRYERSTDYQYYQQQMRRAGIDQPDTRVHISGAQAQVIRKGKVNPRPPIDHPVVKRQRILRQIESSSDEASSEEHVPPPVRQPVPPPMHPLEPLPQEYVLPSPSPPSYREQQVKPKMQSKPPKQPSLHDLLDWSSNEQRPPDEQVFEMLKKTVGPGDRKVLQPQSRTSEVRESPQVPLLPAFHATLQEMGIQPEEAQLPVQEVVPEPLCEPPNFSTLIEHLNTKKQPKPTQSPAPKPRRRRRGTKRYGFQYFWPDSVQLEFEEGLNPHDIQAMQLAQIRERCKQQPILLMHAHEGNEMSQQGWFVGDETKRVLWHLFGVTHDDPIVAPYYLVEWRRRDSGFKPTCVFVKQMDLLMHAPVIYVGYNTKYTIMIPRRMYT